ncbi:hypothetical protein [Pseudidiomarina sp.]|uniref:hypothetical protein n=1 Tax=Pseudidiomarina sp. TaxID=2081707 RepID=UPI003A97D53C
MNTYNALGTINTLFIIFSLVGVYSQLRKVKVRKLSLDGQQGATELLSLNQFSVSFLAYLSFFVYGYSIEPFNHYIVWPRFLASILVFFILFEIWLDRRSKGALICVSIATLCLIAASLGLLLGSKIVDQGKLLATSLIVAVTIMIAQGYFHQIRLIITAKQTGAVDIRMSQFILMMDISTIAFALSMGLANGWPLLMLATISAITKLIIMYLFRWVRIQPSNVS